MFFDRAMPKALSRISVLVNLNFSGRIPCKREIDIQQMIRNQKLALLSIKNERWLDGGQSGKGRILEEMKTLTY